MMNGALFQLPVSPTPVCCQRCVAEGVDLQIKPCNCRFHARCVATPLQACPCCHTPVEQIYLLPMSFEEIDEAKLVAAQSSNSGSKRGQKRKNATIARLNPEVSATMSSTRDESTEDASDLRTGRWTKEEMAYCDQLIEKFASGKLPVADGTKLNDFLALMLKSKQSRLTKKMKNAKLSTKSFTRVSGYIVDATDAHNFSETENSFFRSIPCSMERAEIRFHLQKEWRELYSTFCVQLGQQLDADDWLSSVEEMDRRASRAKDAARMARRKKMMGYALRQDIQNPDQGVFIERSANSFSTLSEQGDSATNGRSGGQASSSSSSRQPSPFLGRVASYMQKHRIPFEHVDAWVPSYVSNPGQQQAANGQQKCRLCFAGAATTNTLITADSCGSGPLSAESKFDLKAFAEYSEKFSFEVGCGLPGRVYQSGIPSWEQNVQNAPHSHFERCGGASQWKIMTVLAVPIPSPNVGRIVVLLYSQRDRPRNQELVGKLVGEMTKLLPSPKWKLVVDVGKGQATAPIAPLGVVQQTQQENDTKVDEILALIEENMPSDSNAATAQYIPGFTSLRQLLLKPGRIRQENEVLKTLNDRFVMYSAENRSRSDVALHLARDYMLMSSQQNGTALQNGTAQQIAAAPTVGMQLSGLC